MSQFEDFMSALSRFKGGSLECDGNRASLELEDVAYDFYYEPASQKLLLVTMIAELPQELSSLALGGLCKRLLKGQFAFSECGGFTFGLTPEHDFLSLQALWSLEGLTEQEFLGQFENFVSTSSLWERKLRPLVQPMEADCSAGTPAGSFDMLRV